MGIEINHLKGDISLATDGSPPTLGGKSIESYLKIPAVYIDEATNSVAIGAGATATHQGSIAIGPGAESVADFSIAYRISPNSNCKYSELFMDGQVATGTGGFIFLNSASPFDFPNGTSVGFSFTALGQETRPGQRVGQIKVEGVASKANNKITIIDCNSLSTVGTLLEPEIQILAGTGSNLGLLVGIKRSEFVTMWQVYGQLLHS